MQVWGAWQLRETSRLDQKRPPPSPPPPPPTHQLFFLFFSFFTFFLFSFFLSFFFYFFFHFSSSFLFCFFFLLLHFGMVLSTDGAEREQSRRRSKVWCLEHEFHVRTLRAGGVSMTVLKCTVSFRLLGVTVGDLLIVT